MIAQRIPFAERSPHDLRILRCCITYHEESSLGPVPFQNIKQTGRMFRIGAIIECQSGNVFLSLYVGDRLWQRLFGDECLRRAFLPYDGIRKFSGMRPHPMEPHSALR